MKTAIHTKVAQFRRRYIYLTIAEEILMTSLDKAFPTAEEKMPEI